MSKKRRTRKEKIAASQKQDFSNVFSVLTPSSLKIETSVRSGSVGPQAVSRLQHDYSYVLSDIRKTSSIIFGLAILNIAIFALLKLNIVNLFGIVF